MVWNFLLASLGQLSQPCSFPTFCAPPHWQSMRKVLDWAPLNNNPNISLLSTLCTKSKTQQCANLGGKLALSQTKPGQTRFGMLLLDEECGLSSLFVMSRNWEAQLHSSTVLMLALAGRCHCSPGWTDWELPLPAHPCEHSPAAQLLHWRLWEFHSSLCPLGSVMIHSRELTACRANTEP